MKPACLYFAMPFVVLLSCKEKRKENTAPGRTIAYSVKKIFPHDVKAFTQGLTVAGGKLFESTGQAGSWIAEVDVASGIQDKKIILDEKYFGEGITVLHNKIYQLTWQNHVGFIYDLKTFKKTVEFHFDHEGWGITADDKNIIVSDGTSKIRFLDTLTLKLVKEISVTESGGEIDNLNELEFVDGFIFANQWRTNFIVKIDPATGQVVGRIDLSELAEKIYPLNPSADVLNGVAYEKKSKLLLVTGKYWPALFALKIN
jgi:glutaminyl-peptide cyclotransferase